MSIHDEHRANRAAIMSEIETNGKNANVGKYRALIAGQSEFGKTSLARSFVKPLYRAGYVPCVIDPMDNDWPGPHQRFYDISQLLDFAKANYALAIFIDECPDPDIIGPYPVLGQKWFGMQSRHNFHCMHFLGVRTKEINKSIRDQCNQLYLFNVDVDDARDLYLRWNDKIILKAHDLKPYHYIHKMRAGPPAEIKPPIKL